MQCAAGELWLSVVAIVSLALPVAMAAAPRAWSYKDWRPGGERTTLDGITFDSTIHCGNGHNFVKVAEGHYRFRARVDQAPYAWRFCFKIECPEAVGRAITLEVADLDHAGRTPWHEGATVCSTDNETWRTLGTENIKIVPWTPTGHAAIDRKYGDRSHIPYGVQYRLKLTRPVMWLAVPTPYTLARRDTLLERLAKQHPKAVGLSVIGHSHHSKTHGWPLRMARITAPGDASKRASLFIIAGEHSSETAGIYACEGWMEEVLAHPDWLDEFVFYFVPIVNVDGVYYGTSYYNMAPSLARGIGQNVSTGWAKRTLPEVNALWPLLVKLRPAFFASLHNGRHRHTMEMMGASGPDADALLAGWRKELGFKVEGIRPVGGPRAWSVLNGAGIVRLAYTIETLVLCRQEGFETFQASYLATGRQLARGTVAGLRASRSRRRDVCRLAGAAFTSQLPWFYHGLPLETPREHHVYSFEANALSLPPGDYTVALVPKGARRKLAVGFDGKTFEDIPVRDGRVELPKTSIRNRMLSLHVRAPGFDGRSPLESVWVYPPENSFAEAKGAATPFRAYRRHILAGDRDVLRKDDWGELWTLLHRPGFGKRQLRAMFNDIVAWCKRRQVLDPGDIHCGAIYSEEDKYDFRDAAAAAVCFTYAWRDTGDDDYHRRALLARSYCYRGQHMNPKNKVRCGGFAHMVHGAWGGKFQRLGKRLPGVVGVETAINVNLLVKTFELGLEPSRKDIEHLRAAAIWMARNEFEPGVFSHHEGSTHDCQNSNALGAMALSRAYYALEKLGEKPPKQWLEAARRGMLHFLEGQEAIGCWPYIFATTGRGQAFSEQNIPDQGMGVYHFLVACETPAFRDLPGIEDALERAARWWLCMSRIDRSGPTPTIDLDDRRASGTLEFSAFTWCRFMAAASLVRIAELTGEKEPWRQLALRYMEHVNTKLWNTTNRAKAPVRRATRPKMTLCSWIQAAEWDGVLLREMEDRLP